MINFSIYCLFFIILKYCQLFWLGPGVCSIIHALPTPRLQQSEYLSGFWLLVLSLSFSQRSFFIELDYWPTLIERILCIFCTSFKDIGIFSQNIHTASCIFLIFLNSYFYLQEGTNLYSWRKINCNSHQVTMAQKNMTPKEL